MASAISANKAELLAIANAVATDPTHASLGHGREVLAVEQDAPGVDPRRRRRQKPHDGLRRDTLAAAGFTHQPQCLARRNGEAHVFDDTNEAVLGVEADCQTVDIEQCSIVHSKTTRGK